MTLYIGIVRDHSASMQRLKRGAADDYNLTLAGIQQSAVEENQVTYASVVECGVGALGVYRVVEQGVPVARLQPALSYTTNGSATPLWDSVGAAMAECQQAAARDGVLDHIDTTFLIMAITDGENNRSQQWTATSLSAEIRRRQATDRWTFAFRVPPGHKAALVRMGIHEGNIMEWEQSERALTQSTEATVSSVKGYFRGLSQGVRSSTSFYADAGALSKTVVKENLRDITAGLRAAFVKPALHGTAIREFCLSEFGDYTAGAALYQLTKPEKVQGHKQIAIREVATGKFFSGPEARQLLGLPSGGEIKVIPAQSGNQFEIFVQSTSFTRKLVGGTTVIYMDGPH